MAIHPTAVISPRAVIGENVEIGPYSIIEDDVVIGDECWIDSHVKIYHDTKIGPRCRIYYGALIGGDPQDRGFTLENKAETVVGEDTVIREYVTIHRSPSAGGVTRIGSHVMLMAFVHVAHDCRIGDYVTIANSTSICGHVQIGDYSVLSGFILIHQFVRIGELCMVAARTILVQDIPPFCLLGENNYIYGPNVVGMRRAGISSAERLAVRRAMKLYFFSDLNGGNAINEILKDEPLPPVRRFVEFIEQSTRGIIGGNPAMIHREAAE